MESHWVHWIFNMFHEKLPLNRSMHHARKRYGRMVHTNQTSSLSLPSLFWYCETKCRLDDIKAISNEKFMKLIRWYLILINFIERPAWWSSLYIGIPRKLRVHYFASIIGTCSFRMTSKNMSINLHQWHLLLCINLLRETDQFTINFSWQPNR